MKQNLLRATCAISVATLVSAGATPPAAAQVGAEMSQIKCSDYMAETPAHQKLIAAWMNGYYHAKQNQPIVDWARFNANIQSVWKYCKGNQNDTLMNAISKAAF